MLSSVTRKVKASVAQRARAREIGGAVRKRLSAALSAGDAAALGATLDEEGLSPDSKIDGQPLLHLSLRGAGGAALASALLDRGARIDARDRLGLTALMDAAFNGRKDALSLLLARGADATLVGAGSGVLGWLMCGAETEFAVPEPPWWDEVLRALVEAGADPLLDAGPVPKYVRKQIARDSGGDIDPDDADVFTAGGLAGPSVALSCAAALQSPVPLERLLAQVAPPLPPRAVASTPSIVCSIWERTREAPEPMAPRRSASPSSMERLPSP